MSQKTRHAWVWAEMARRKVQFHPKENWQDLRLWGLFSWGTVSDLLNEGKLITHMKKENKTVWVWPSEAAYHEHIEPLLGKPMDELMRLSGWIS